MRIHQFVFKRVYALIALEVEAVECVQGNSADLARLEVFTAVWTRLLAFEPVVYTIAAKQHFAMRALLWIYDHVETHRARKVLVERMFGLLLCEDNWFTS